LRLAQALKPFSLEQRCKCGPEGKPKVRSTLRACDAQTGRQLLTRRCAAARHAMSAAAQHLIATTDHRCSRGASRLCVL